jgi:hypothetical protein
VIEENPPAEENQSIEEQYPQVEEMLSEVADSPASLAAETLDGVQLIDDPEGVVQAGCGPSGCAYAVAIVAFVAGVSAFLFGDALFGSDASTQDASQTESQEAVQPDVGGTSPLLAYENQYDAEGNLIPIPGEWHVYNEAGVDTCIEDLSLDPSVQSMELAVLDGGERIRIQEIVEGELVGPRFDLDRISSSATEATYREDMSEVIGRDQAIEGTFSSSSTWGGRVEGCPERGAQGSLVEPSE